MTGDGEALGALGAALGPVIGGLLVGLGWRWVFWVNLPVGIVAIVLALRVVPESRDDAPRGRPDLLGALLLALAVGLVAGALVKASDWGWASAAFVGAVAAAVLCGVLLVVRSAHRVAPVLELGLFRSRAFSGAGAASVLYFAGFGALVLNTVEFLTAVWHYSPVQAGLAIAPGPLMVLPFARLVAPRLIPWSGGVGRVAGLGCAVSGVAQAVWLVSLQAEPAYLTHLLPAQLLGGAGVGLAIPSLLGAGSAALPAAHFGTGSGILNMVRQVGTVIGVAALVAALTVPAADPLTAFRHGVVLIIGFFVAAGVVCLAVLCRRARPAAVLPARPDTRSQEAA